MPCTVLTINNKKANKRMKIYAEHTHRAASIWYLQILKSI